MQHIFKQWFVFVILITLIAGLVSITVQQSYRQTANDPQIAMAHDLVFQLENGKKFTPSTTKNIAKEYGTFTMLYSENGTVVASEAVLNNKNPMLPHGVLDYAKKNGQNRLTWEPQKGVRLATIVYPYSHGFVLVGRSLYETELRETSLEQGVALFWIVSNIIMLAVITGVSQKKGKKS